MSHLMIGGRFSLLVWVLTILPAAAALAQPQRSDGLVEQLRSKPIAIEEGDSAELKLLKERYNAVTEEMEFVLASVIAGVSDWEPAFDCMLRLGKSKLDLAKNASERVEMWEQILKICQTVEKVTADRVAGGRVSRAVLARAKYQRLDAELSLLRAKKELPKTGSAETSPGQYVVYPRFQERKLLHKIVLGRP
jgi:hypothetical protein